MSDKLQFVAAAGERRATERQHEQLKTRYRIGVWDADALENTFAYVGSELRVTDWLNRAAKLIKELPAAAATKELLNIDSGEPARDPDEADQIENAETAKVEEKDVEKKRRPSRDIHPAAIAWTALVIEEFASRIRAVPQSGTPARIALGVDEVAGPVLFSQANHPAGPECSRQTVNCRRRCSTSTASKYCAARFVAAIKSIEIGAGVQWTVSRRQNHLRQRASAAHALATAHRRSTCPAAGSDTNARPPSLKKCVAHSVHSRELSAPQTSVACACSKQPMCVVCAFAPSSLPDWSKADFHCAPRATGSIRTKSANG